MVSVNTSLLQSLKNCLMVVHTFSISNDVAGTMFWEAELVSCVYVWVHDVCVCTFVNVCVCVCVCVHVYVAVFLYHMHASCACVYVCVCVHVCVCE